MIQFTSPIFDGGEIGVHDTDDEHYQILEVVDKKLQELNFELLVITYESNFDGKCGHPSYDVIIIDKIKKE